MLLFFLALGVAPDPPSEPASTAFRFKADPPNPWLTRLRTSPASDQKATFSPTVTRCDPSGPNLKSVTQDW